MALYQMFLLLTFMCMKSVMPSFGSVEASTSIKRRPVTKFATKHSFHIQKFTDLHNNVHQLIH